MTIEPLAPDVAPDAVQRSADPNAFAKALDDLGALFEQADRAEDGYARGSAGLGEAVYERARADVALSVAAAAAGRASAALTAIFNLQI